MILTARRVMNLGTIVMAASLVVLVAFATELLPPLYFSGSGWLGKFVILSMSGILVVYAVAAWNRKALPSFSSILLHTGLLALLVVGISGWSERREDFLTLAQGESQQLPEWAGGFSITPEEIQVFPEPLGGVAQMRARLNIDGRSGITEVNSPLETPEARFYIMEAGPALGLTLRSPTNYSEIVAKIKSGQPDIVKPDGFEPITIIEVKPEQYQLRYGNREAHLMSAGDVATWGSTSITLNDSRWWIRMKATNSGRERIVIAGLGLLAMALLLEMKDVILPRRT